MTFTPASFDLAAHLRNETALIGKMAEQKGVVLTVTLPETAVVTGDSNMLATVVRNLLTNAVKFTPAGGTVTLTVEPFCNDRTRPAATGYTVAVSDTGTGMTPEQIQNLFRIDRQPSREGTAGEKGSGLGLIVCRELLEKHGSKLHIESGEGKGSMFRFELRQEKL
jgi:signal transduction histidine kinase